MKECSVSRRNVFELLKEGSRDASVYRSCRRMMLVAAELTCEYAHMRERTQIRADPDRDARQANIMCVA